MDWLQPNIRSAAGFRGVDPRPGPASGSEKRMVAELRDPLLWCAERNVQPLRTAARHNTRRRARAEAARSYRIRNNPALGLLPPRRNAVAGGEHGPLRNNRIPRRG